MVGMGAVGILLLALFSGGRTGQWDRRIAAYRAAGLPVNFEELDRSYPQVPEAENEALKVIRSAEDWKGTLKTKRPSLLQLMAVRGTNWSLEERHLVETELEANASSLALLHSLSHPERSRYPTRWDSLPGGTKYINFRVGPAYSTAQRALLEARYAFETGQRHRATIAWVSALRAFRTTDAVPQSVQIFLQGALRPIMVGQLASMLSTSGCELEDLKMLQAELAEEEGRQTLEPALRGDRCVLIESIFRRTPSGLRDPDGMGADNSLKNRLWITLWTGSGQFDRDLLQALDEVDDFAARLKGRASDFLATEPPRNPEGGIRARIDEWIYPHRRLQRSTLHSFWLVQIKNITSIRAATAGLALERWRLDHGNELPPNLEALVPQYLPAVPVDPIDGKPLRLRFTHPGYIIYGLGEDRVDNGGIEFPKTNSVKGPAGRDYGFAVER